MKDLSLLAPLIGYFGRKFGAEAVTLAGCLLSAVGVGACFFAEDIFTIAVCWGGIFGFGYGLGSILVPEILDTYFTKHYDKANGIYLSGSSLSSLLLPPIAEKSINAYGLSGMFLILSGLMLNCVTAAIILLNFKRRLNPSATELEKIAIHTTSVENDSFLKATELHKSPESSEVISGTSKNPSDSGHNRIGFVSNSNICFRKHGKDPTASPDVMKTPAKEKSKNVALEVIQIFLDPTFIIILITHSSVLFVFSAVWTVVIDFARDAGVATDQEVYLLMGIGISDTVGRLALGCITDAGYVSKKNFSACCFALLGVAVLSLIAVRGIVMTTTAVCAIGLFIGGQIMIGPGIAVLFFEKETLMMALACRFMLHPVIGLLQPFLIEYSRDVRGSYNVLFYFLAGLNFLCVFLTMLLPIAKRFSEKRTQDLEEKETCAFPK